MTAINWKSSGSEFLGIAAATKEEPGFAYSIQRGDEIFYCCMMEIKIHNTPVNVCIVSDATHFNNDNHRAAIAHYKKSCFTLRPYAEITADTGNLLKIAEKRRFNYKIIGIISFGIVEGKPVVWPIDIWLLKPYHEKGIVNSMFDFLSDRLYFSIDTERLNIAGGDVTMAESDELNED